MSSRFSPAFSSTSLMARVLEVKVEELGALGAQSTKDVAISSTCTVFAESEVISQLSQDTDKRDIINGIHHSVASRVAGLAHRVGVRDQVVMTGGVAQNTGVVKALEEKGYNPINQLVGYILSEDPTYITNHNSARSLICKIDRDELLQVLVKSYLEL